MCPSDAQHIGGKPITSDRPAPESRLGHVDALRGIAALCVCVQHFVVPIIAVAPAAAAGHWLLDGLTTRWFDLGRFGVVLFFLISGLVIPYSLKGDRAIRRFVISRLFRLYPAFWLSVAVTITVGLSVGLPQPAIREILANLTMMPKLLHQDYVSGVYWTLYIELIFYAACALLFLTRQLRNPHVIVAIGLACNALPLVGIAARAVGHHAPILYLTAHLSFLFDGYLIRQAMIDGNRRARIYAVILSIASLATMPVLAAQPDHLFTVSTPAGVLLAGLAALAAFVIVNHRCPIPSPALLWAGAISYSVYLFHIPATHLAETWLAPTSMVTAIGFSSLVYLAIEKPAIAAGRRIIHARRETLAMEIAP